MLHSVALRGFHCFFAIGNGRLMPPDYIPGSALRLEWAPVRSRGWLPKRLGGLLWLLAFAFGA
jgi:hypothetical protein